MRVLADLGSPIEYKLILPSMDIELSKAQSIQLVGLIYIDAVLLQISIANYRTDVWTRATVLYILVLYIPGIQDIEVPSTTTSTEVGLWKF